MRKCPTCDGTGQMKITMFEGWPKKDEVGKALEIECIDCDGAGEIDEETFERIEFEKNMWCVCEGDYGTKYYEDGEHPEISKHHWRCLGCGKVKQIG